MGTNTTSRSTYRINLGVEDKSIFHLTLHLNVIHTSWYSKPFSPPPLLPQAPVASLGVLISWACSLMVAVSFLPALQGMGIGGIFMIFGVFTVLGLTLVATTAVRLSWGKRGTYEFRFTDSDMNDPDPLGMDVYINHQPP